MAVTYEGRGTVLDNAGASATVAWPTHQADDIGILVMEASGGGAAISPPTGWDELVDLRDVSTTAGSRVHVFAIRATSSSMTAPTVAAQQDHKVAAIHVFRGVDPSPAVSTFTVASGTKASASTTATLPSITTPVANCMVVLIASRPDDSSSTTAFGTPSNGNLTGIDAGDEAGTVTGNGGGFVVAYGFMASAGATGTTTMSCPNVTNTYTVIALPPVPSGVDGTASPSVFAVSSTANAAAGVTGGATVSGSVLAVSAVANAATVTGSSGGTASPAVFAKSATFNDGPSSAGNTGELVTEDFNAGSDEDAATTGNTSATSVTGGGAPEATLTLDTARSISGSKSLRVSPAGDPSGVSNFRYLEFDLSSRSDTYVSFYLYRDAAVGDNSQMLAILNASNVTVTSLTELSTGALFISAGGVGGTASTGVISTGQWYRIDVTARVGVGVSVYAYTGATLHSTNTADAATSATANTNAANHADVRFGATGSTGVNGWNRWMDYLQVSGVAMPSPYGTLVQGLTVTGTASTTPATFTTAATFNAATASGGGGGVDGTATPASTATSTVPNTATVTGGATVTPATTATSASSNATTVTGGSSTTPATFTAAAVTNASTPSGAANTAPANFAVTSTANGATAGGGSATTPASTANTVTFNAATPSGNANTTPATFTAAHTSNTATVNGGGTVTPATFPTSATPNAPTVSGGSAVSGTATPPSTTLTAAFTAPTLSGAANTTPAPHTATASPQGPTVTASGAASGGTYTVTVSVNAGTATGNTAVNPGVFAAAASIGAATATGASSTTPDVFTVAAVFNAPTVTFIPPNVGGHATGSVYQLHDVAGIVTVLHSSTGTLAARHAATGALTLPHGVEGGITQPSTATGALTIT